MRNARHRNSMRHRIRRCSRESSLVAVLAGLLWISVQARTQAQPVKPVAPVRRDDTAAGPGSADEEPAPARELRPRRPRRAAGLRSRAASPGAAKGQSSRRRTR